MGKFNLLSDIRMEFNGHFFKEIVSILIPLFLYALSLVGRIPPSIGLSLRYDLPFFYLAIALLLLLLAFRIPGWLGRLVSLSLTLILFASLLSALWSSGASDIFIVGGVLPWTDANVYYWDARRLIAGENFTPSVDHQRPLGTGLLAVLLGLTQQNLQIAIALLVLITAIACFFVGREVQRTHGPMAGAIVVLGLFLYYRPFSGSVMTENLGLALGSLGLASLFRGARTHQVHWALLGLFLLTLGLNARMGFILVLPAILLWGAYVYRGSNRISWRFLIMGTGLIVLGFAINGILQKTIGAPGSVAFSNSVYTIYGLLTHSDWSYIFTQYPELHTLGAVERTQTVRSLIMQVIRENPISLITGPFRAWQEFLFGQRSLFFTYHKASILDSFLKLLGTIGIFNCCRNWRHPNASLLLAIAIGILASTPILPIWDADIRPYATTMAIFYLLPALGLLFLLKYVAVFFRNLLPNEALRQHSFTASTASYASFQDSLALFVFGIALATLVFVGPLMIKLISHPSQVAATNVCPQGLEARYFRMNPGSFVHLVRNRELVRTHLPYVRIRDFKQNLAGFASVFPDEAKGFRSLKASTSIVDTYNFEWLVAPTSMLPKETGPIFACGKQEKFGQTLLLFKADSIQSLQFKLP